MKAKVNKVSIQLVHGELFDQPVAALVNETDSYLNLTPALLSRAGLSIQREISTIGYCEVGSAIITSAGNVSVQNLIHAVVPRWGEGSERGKLSNVTFECLHMAEQNRLKSIAFPPLSTGERGYPVENCARTMLSQIIDYTFEDLRHLRMVIICLREKLAFEVFRGEFQNQLDALSEDDSAKLQG